jgi:DNA (cytosine-5)-methyltransferase 1
MVFIEQNKREFVKGKENFYRRMTIRECARLQQQNIFKRESI